MVKLNTARMNVLEVSTGSVATLPKNFFQSSLYDNDPWSTLAREAAWLVGLTAAFGAAARLGMRRLLA